jgi:DNA-binding transcriptional LysR family regulator
MDFDLHRRAVQRKYLSMSPAQRTLPPFAALRAFEAVGRLGGIRRAAEALDLDHAVVSRHLRALEEHLGVQLLRRSRGSVALTAAGERYYRRISPAIAELINASTDMAQASSERRLCIWCVPGLASLWLTSRLKSFQAAHPDIEIELQSSHQGPDFTQYEADVDIRYVAGDEHVSAAVTQGGLRRFEVARPAVLAVASPALLATLPQISTATDLLQSPLLHEESDDQWYRWLTAYGAHPDRPMRGPRLWPAQITLEAARRGQGIALANNLLLTEDLAAGDLVVVWPLAQLAAVALGAYVFTARADRWHSHAVAQFRNWLRSATAP